MNRAASAAHTAPLYGLVLAGGRSRRMHRDKAALEYRGRTQLAETFERLRPLVERAFVSVRSDQREEATRRDFPQIIDRPGLEGPIAGIAAAQQEHPEAAWLVLACDLPFLETGTLEHLRAQRDARRLATAFRSSHDGLPEPLCAIWEPASREPLTRYTAAGRNCPRKFLIESDARLLDQPDPRALDNVNSAAEYWSAMDRIDPQRAATTRRVRVQYYALLREQAGRSEERLETRARSPRELYEELRARHPFTLEPAMLRVAINAEFGDWAQPLSEGDTIVFIPPVAGG